MSTFRRCEKMTIVCKEAAVGDCQLVNIELGGQGEPRGRSSQMVIYFARAGLDFWRQCVDVAFADGCFCCLVFADGCSGILRTLRLMRGVFGRLVEVVFPSFFDAGGGRQRSAGVSIKRLRVASRLLQGSSQLNAVGECAFPQGSGRRGILPISSLSAFLGGRRRTRC